jgi:hypothetical protein
MRAYGHQVSQTLARDRCPLPTENDLPRTPPGIRYEIDEAMGHTTSVVGHWRLLIPAEGKPWRGSAPWVVWVRTHERYVHGKRRVRFHVVR